MNEMELLATLLGLTAIGLFVWGDKQRLRKEDLEVANASLRRRLRSRGRTIHRLRRMIDKHVEAADLMDACNGELERRNLWLEQRRYTILQRWWRRSPHRTLGPWQVRRAGGA